MTARKTVKTAERIDVKWFVTGRGKTAQYFAAVPATQAAEGAEIALIAQSGAITYGVLNAPVSADSIDEKAAARIPTGSAVWTFSRQDMTAEMRAENAAKKADARAAFLRSDAGIAQAERIAARAAKKAADAAEGLPDTKTVTVSHVAADTPPASKPAAADGPTMAEQAQALRDAGFTAAEVLAALSQMNPPASKPATPASKPRTGKPVSLAALNAAAGKRGAK